VVVVVLATWSAVAMPPAWAQAGSTEIDGTELTVPVQESLVRLQDLWLLWNSAFLQDDQRLAEAAIRDLLFTATDLGQSRLPDLAIGVLVRGVDSARAGEFERGRWAVRMAERLDPGRPEAMFAKSRIDFLEGSYIEGVLSRVRGFARLTNAGLPGRLYGLNLAVWLGASLMLASALFVALQLATKGGALLRDTIVNFAVTLPRPVALVLALGLLIWPFLLPNGWIWLVLFWAALLWPYGSGSERVALAASVVILTLVPVLVHVAQDRLDASLSPQRRFLDRVQSRSLYGQFFNDLGLLKRTLPDSVALDHLVADLHVGLGQDDIARPIYRGVVDEEPDNGAALNNLGAYHLFRSEHIAAIGFLERALGRPEGSLEAAYNLGMTYQQLFENTNADRYFDRAREIDADRVSAWLSEGEDGVVALGGLQRIDELRGELNEVLGPPSLERGSMLRALGVLVATFLLAFLWWRFSSGAPLGVPATALGRESWLERLARVVVPGLGSAESGDGARGFLALLVPTAALMLPFHTVIGFSLPWGYEPGATFPWIVAIAVVSVFYAVRLAAR
jgi:tetratricopeptide (TPR) repeat protein